MMYVHGNKRQTVALAHDFDNMSNIEESTVRNKHIVKLLQFQNNTKINKRTSLLARDITAHVMRKKL